MRLHLWDRGGGDRRTFCGRGRLHALAVATVRKVEGGMRITRGPNHGRRSRKFNQDCMIRHSCCSTRSDSDVSGLRVKLNRLAGIRGAPVRSNSTSLVLHWTSPRPFYAAI